MIVTSFEIILSKLYHIWYFVVRSVIYDAWRVIGIDVCWYYYYWNLAGKEQFLWIGIVLVKSVVICSL